MSRNGKKRQKKFSKKINQELSHLFFSFLFLTISWEEDMFLPIDMKLLKSVPQIIAELKCERKKRAEIKRQEDLKMIEKLNWNDEASIDDANIDVAGIDPLMIFPEEIWEKIFVYVLDYQDLRNLSRSCYLFHQILKGRFDILFAKASLTEDFYSEVLHDYQCNFLSEGIISNLRERAIDLRNRKFHAEKALSVCGEFQNCVSNPISCFGRRGVEEAVDYLGNLETSWNQDTSSLRLLRYRTFSFSIDLNECNSLNLITNALEDVGGSIWNFGLCICDNHGFNWKLTRETALAQIYPLLVNWVSLTPNIHRLKISAEIVVHYVFFQWGLKKMRIPKQTISNHPFPHLKNLKQLHLSLTVESDLWEAILGANPHIQSLIIEEAGFTSKRTSKLIKSLNLISFCYKSDSLDTSDQAYVESCLNLSWPLKEINLQLFVKTISMPRLFEMLGYFKTLNTVFLKITLKEWTDLDYEASDDSDDEWDSFYEYLENKQSDDGLYFLTLPYLTKFKFEYEGMIPGEKQGRHHFSSIDYLRVCTKLETLEWKNLSLSRFTNYRKLKAREELIQFQGGFMNLDWSNIWKIFPCLESVQIYNRERSHKYLRHEETFFWQD